MCLCARKTKQNQAKQSNVINFWIQCFVFVCCVRMCFFRFAYMLLRPYTSVACANTLHMLNKFPLFVVVRGGRMGQPTSQPASERASERACMCWSVIFYAMSISTNFFIIIIVLLARVVAVLLLLLPFVWLCRRIKLFSYTKSNLCTLTEILGWVYESLCRKFETKTDSE